MFVFKDWEFLCRNLKNNNIYSISASNVLERKQGKSFCILKHDVETNPRKALKLALIENKYGHCGSYYVQAYLLNKKENIKILKQIASLGHEVTYHLDVMDHCKGDIVQAEKEFLNIISQFKGYGFQIKTVCQHGNPLMTRIGYHGNRDFFRNEQISIRYNQITEIMVNFRERCYDKNYIYISDAGYGWKIISSPEDDDIPEKRIPNISIGNLDNVLSYIKSKSVIISTHPHRWCDSTMQAICHDAVFFSVRKIAKLMIRIPIIRDIMKKNYHFAKKI